MVTDDNKASADPERIQAMFSRITSRYDLMNRVMTLGRDQAWRRATVESVAPSPGSRALDIGCGTGDLTIHLLRADVGLAVGLDPVRDMLYSASSKIKNQGSVPALVRGDALALPFPDETFDCVVSAFVMRNVSDLPAAIRESRRVLRPGGRLGILELTPMRIPLLSGFFRFYFHAIVPMLGGWITGDRAAYEYLPASVDRFPDAKMLSGMLSANGFNKIRFRRFMMATVALHVAEK